MRVRRLPGLVVLATALVLAAGGAAWADTTPAGTVNTTAAPTATAPAVTTTTAPPPATTTAATATTAAPAATTTSTTDATTTTPGPAAAPTATPLAVSPARAANCPPVGAVGLLLPHREPVVLAPQRTLASAEVAYPADGSILTATGVSLASSCTETRPTAGSAQVRGLSLFGGAVTARTVTMSLLDGAGSVSGLTVSGRPVTLEPGHPIRIADWGYVIAPDPAAASKSAFEVEIAQEHAGLPPGTLVFVPYARIATAPPAPAASPTPTATTGKPAVRTRPEPAASATPTTTTARHAARTPPEAAVTRRPKPAPATPVRRTVTLGSSWVNITVPGLRHGATHEPLKVTPPLHGGPYLFPVTGTEVDFGDTYGGLRSDVPGGWHHGDDIFAPLGTPVVAVADGTLNRVGWERLGGWRLWVRDRDGDEFYYAHLSGYSPLALKHRRVHRGEVIGFVGNTGDAFTTLPHLHFEVHPRSLLHLQYDGAVDPTSYLGSWSRPGTVRAPAPVHPRLPRNPAWLREATVDFGKLLEARGIHPRPVAPVLPAGVAAPLGRPNPLLRAPDPRPAVSVVPRIEADGSSDVPVWLGLGAGAAAGAAAAVAVGLWRRRRPAPA